MAIYTVTEDELTNTADAIRELVGVSSQIEWESNDGFADALKDYHAYPVKKVSAGALVAPIIQSANGSGQLFSTGLIDLSKVTDGYYYNDVGVYTVASICRLTDYISAELAPTYTIKGMKASTASSLALRINYFDSNKTWLSQDKYTVETYDQFTYTITPPAGSIYIRISGNYTGGNHFDWSLMQLTANED